MRATIKVLGTEIDVEYDLATNVKLPECVCGKCGDSPVPLKVKLVDKRQALERLGPPTEETMEAIADAFSEQVAIPFLRGMGNA